MTQVTDTLSKTSNEKDISDKNMSGKVRNKKTTTWTIFMLYYGNFYFCCTINKINVRNTTYNLVFHYSKECQYLGVVKSFPLMLELYVYFSIYDLRYKDWWSLKLRRLFPSLKYLLMVFRRIKFFVFIRNY